MHAAEGAEGSGLGLSPAWWLPPYGIGPSCHRMPVPAGGSLGEAHPRVSLALKGVGYSRIRWRAAP